MNEGARTSEELEADMCSMNVYEFKPPSTAQKWINKFMQYEKTISVKKDDTMELELPFDSKLLPQEPMELDKSLDDTPQLNSQWESPTLDDS